MIRKEQLISCLVALYLGGAVQAQNVGIGTPTPLAKIHVDQPAATDASRIEHSGTAGSTLRLIANNTANTDPLAAIVNSSNGTNMLMVNTGLGRGIELQQNSTGANGTALFISQSGSDVFSRGIELTMRNTATAIANSVFQEGTERGVYVGMTNAASTAAGIDIRQAGRGNGLYIENSLATNPAIGAVVFQDGIGRGWATQMGNTTSTAIASGIYHRGLGIGQEIQLSNASNATVGQLLIHDGVGRGSEINLTNAANAELGQVILHNGLTGTGQYIGLPNAAANNTSIGLQVNYNGTNTVAGGGGGNAVEIQHYGNNGNAMDVFIGNPTNPAGPANTTSEFAALSISHMATGTSPSAGRSKSALNAINNSADPTILVNNAGADNGEGINIFTNPSTTAGALRSGMFSQAQVATNGFGVGVWAQGGNYGVVGSTGPLGANVGVFSNSNFQAVGTKAFVIDYPLDPANKKLRHFCIESDEVLNLYRGMVTLDANGQAIVELPAYFEAINKDFSYQLTAIGTAVQPYVKAEIENNQFIVAGAPNTKVSWTVYAERNDPTVQYFERVQGKDYRSPVTAKESYERGKYLTPEAYGQDRSKGIFYNEEHERLAREAKDGTQYQRAAPQPDLERKKGSNGVSNARDTRPRPTSAKVSKEDLTKR